LKRTDRLMAILIALQQGPETAQTLADKFEVSKRTVLPDMQSLSEMGIPLYSMPGPTGGFRLMEGFRLPPLQLDAQEALTVLFALRAMTKIADTPFNQARWTVMHKIKAALPEQTLKQVEPLLKHLEVEVPERKMKVPHLPALLEYTADSKWLNVLYRSENHRRRLQIQPMRVYTAHGYWYCEAYSVQHREERTFRVDRFEEVEVMAPSHLRDTDQKEQAGLGGTNEPPIRITAKLTYRGALLAEQDFHIGDCVKQVSDEEWELDFMCPAPEWKWAVRFFFSLGMDAEVTMPASLREEIRQIASQLCGRYGPKE
jgi:predicted DNA-binding transcriptional regulator YafY